MRALGGEQSETERESPSCCWITALQLDSSGKSVTAKWDLVPDVSMGQGPVRRSTSALRGPRGPHIVGAVPRGPALRVSPALQWLPGPQLLQPGSTGCL